MKTTRLLAPLFAFALIFGACGGGSEPTEASSESEVSDPSGDATDDGSASEDTAATGGTEVVLQDFAYDPKKTQVSVGDTVVWTNTDDILHTVTSGVGQKQGIPGVSEDKDAKPDGTFDQELEFEDTFEFTFDKAGTYKYFCSIHPGMVGVVEVQ